MTDAVVRKRARSPSPIYADTLAASPLDVLLKRRRRSEWVPSTSTYSGFAPPPPPVEESGTHHGSHDTDNSSQAAASSPLRRQRDEDEEDGWARRGVSRRRTRQWERLQDPTSVASAPNSVQHTMYAQQSYSQQHLPNPYPPQVTPDRVNNMSSSPVRHQPPSSTPFRADEWTEDERLQEWGDHYAAQNGLLHSLHRARVEAVQEPDNLMRTPAQQRTASTHVTPYSALPLAYRYQRTPLDTPGLASSEYASSPMPFSPLDAPAGPAPSPVHYAHEADVVRAGYEETNRLLAALNVARMRRNTTTESPQAQERSEMDEQW